MNPESTPAHPITVVDATSPEEARAELVRQVVDAVLRAHGDEAFIRQAELCATEVGRRLCDGGQLVKSAAAGLCPTHAFRAFVTESITELHARRPDAELPTSGRIEITGVVALPRREVPRG